MERLCFYFVFLVLGWAVGCLWVWLFIRERGGTLITSGFWLWRRVPVPFLLVTSDFKDWIDHSIKYTLIVSIDTDFLFECRTPTMQRRGWLQLENNAQCWCVVRHWSAALRLIWAHVDWFPLCTVEVNSIGLRQSDARNETTTFCVASTSH